MTGSGRFVAVEPGAGPEAVAEDEDVGGPAGGEDLPGVGEGLGEVEGRGGVCGQGCARQGQPNTERSQVDERSSFAVFPSKASSRTFGRASYGEDASGLTESCGFMAGTTTGGRPGGSRRIRVTP